MKYKTRLRLWWHRLWIRRDEFHKSLNMDGGAMREMTGSEQASYLVDLAERRNKAHNKDNPAHCR